MWTGIGVFRRTTPGNWMKCSRKGYRVLLVDKATFPSDTISTHNLTLAAMDAAGGPAD